jgi:hypothetical protein
MKKLNILGVILMLYHLSITKSFYPAILKRNLCKNKKVVTTAAVVHKKENFSYFKQSLNVNGNLTLIKQFYV